MDMKMYALLRAQLKMGSGEGGSTGVLVDPTLSIAGQAADAKATGEKINELGARIDNLVLASGGDAIRVIRINNAALPVVDGIVDIPIADDMNFGLVKSSTGDNRVTVHEDGTMEVLSVSFDRIAQTEDEEITIGGGGSNF